MRLLLPAAALASLPMLLSGQATKAWQAPRTADGQPDLQGVWSAATITPVERPQDLAGKAFFTPEEARAYEKDWRTRNNMDRRDGPTESDVGRAYNDFWWDRGTQVVRTLRTSLVIDPADGRIPALTPQASARQAERTAQRRASSAVNGPEDRPLAERCILFGGGGVPITPTAYNNNYQIVQSRDSVAIVAEMIHDVRVIPLDGRAHVPSSVRLWKGDSIGHWEGDTLVVETTNFMPDTAFRGSSQYMRLVERFSRTAEDTLLYQYTVTDAESFAQPWTVEIPMWPAEGRIYEYACHEGNEGMVGILKAARAAEKVAP